MPSAESTTNDDRERASMMSVDNDKQDAKDVERRTAGSTKPSIHVNEGSDNGIGLVSSFLQYHVHYRWRRRGLR